MDKKDMQKYFDEDIVDAERINHLGNNVLYRVQLSSGSRLLKVYSQLHAQNWPRAETEFSAVEYLWQKGFRNIPQPFQLHKKDHVAVYSFENGRVLKPEEVTERDVLEISDFVVRLHSLDASGFPPASAAALKLEDYATDIESRIKNLVAQCALEGTMEEGTRFLHDEVVPLANRLVREFRGRYSPKELSKEFPLWQQRLNVGDFGIHNVLDACGRKVFLDFEYFGRDDPVRELLGFVHHDKHIAVDRELKRIFVDNYIEATKAPEEMRQRMHNADALKGMSFVLIYLNVLREQYQKQLRAQGADVDKIAKERIDKARRKLEDLTFFQD